jgi:signal transduction histidine kinase
VTGDVVLLERLTHNLLDNAIRYNATDGGWIAVTTATADGHACLTVENTGPVVPADEVDALFEPFRRLTATDRLTAPDPAPPGRGAGLGLSIVRAVAHAHQGQAHAHPRPSGGLTIQVRIPTEPATRPRRTGRKNDPRRPGRGAKPNRGRVRRMDVRLTT